MSDDSTSAVSKIPMLTSDNVQRWKTMVENEALRLGAADILTGDEVEPDKEDDLKEWKEYRRTRQKLAYAILSTLDLSQTEAILAGVKKTDPQATFIALLDHYIPKTAQSRASAIQELLSIRKNDTETFGQYGTRIITAGSAIRDRLATLPLFITERTRRARIDPSEIEYLDDSDEDDDVFASAPAVLPSSTAATPAPGGSDPPATSSAVTTPTVDVEILSR